MTETARSSYMAGESAFSRWRSSLIAGEPRPVFPHSLPVPEMAPGNIMLIGGAPGVGKTAFVMSMVVEALRYSEGMRALVVNVEMPPDALLDRQLARLSGINVEDIRHRQSLARHKERLDTGLATLATVVERLAFLRGPFSLPNVASAADDHRADLIVLDYIQRISPPGVDADARASVNRTMACLREFSSSGCAVVVVSAVGRTRDAQGRASYSGSGLSLASFRESSELEFGADDAYMLAPISDSRPELLRLAHLKCRNGALRSVDLAFDRPRQSFAMLDGQAAASSKRGRDIQPLLTIAALASEGGMTACGEKEAALSGEGGAM